MKVIPSVSEPSAKALLSLHGSPLGSWIVLRVEVPRLARSASQGRIIHSSPLYTYEACRNFDFTWEDADGEPHWPQAAERSFRPVILLKPTQPNSGIKPHVRAHLPVAQRLELGVPGPEHKSCSPGLNCVGLRGALDSNLDPPSCLLLTQEGTCCNTSGYFHRCP